MRETPLSNCEKEFILKAISEKKRLDGREAYDYRHMRIGFGIDRGCCTVQLGDTRVLAQVSCEVTEPKLARPNEGVLFVNVELSPMAASHFEPGRQSEFGVEITRLLERCIKESRCVDTESLCIVAGVKVFAIRVDVHILNHDGNLVDCGSVAAIAALSHFRRPDVTVSGEDVTIHSVEDKDPVALSVHHMPICVTFAFFDQGRYMLVDPTDKEEKVMDGKMVIGMNKHREICTMQMTGDMLLLKDQVLRCSNIAVVKVAETTELINKAIENDAKARSSGEKFGFASSVETTKATALVQSSKPVTGVPAGMEDSDEIVPTGSDMDDDDVSETEVKITAPGTGKIGEGGPSTWIIEDDTEMVVQEKLQQIRSKTSKSKQVQDIVVLDSDSDNETIQQQTDTRPKTSKKGGTGEPSIDLTAALKSKKKKGKKFKT